MICSVSFVYSCECSNFPYLSGWFRGSLVTARTVYKLYKRERALEEILKTCGSINRSRYFRLMALASVDILGCIPLGTYVLVRNVRQGIERWTGWANMHKDFTSIEQIPSASWRSQPDVVTCLEFFRWVLVVVAFIFFAFFGFAQEACHHYRLVFTWLATKARSGRQAVWARMEDGLRGRPALGQGGKCAA